MLYSLNDLIGYAIQATDRRAGKVGDVYVDDVLWSVRHIAVADAGGVGIQMASVDPETLGAIDTAKRQLHVTCTHDEIAGGPDVSLDPPVSRSLGASSDPRLRSVGELKGYAVLARDGGVGSIDDFIVDPDDWKIHFIVVATDSPVERKVLVGPGLIDRVDFDARTVHVELEKPRFAQSPEYDPKNPIERVEDVRLVGRTDF